MSLVIKLDSLIGRITVVVLALVICGASVRLIYSHFNIRFMSDPRLSLSSEALDLASKRTPNSPRIHYRLAEAEMANIVGQEQVLKEAISHAEQAVNLSLWDYRMRRLLGTLQEMNGDQENAEKSLRAAALLAPNNSDVNWVLANLLLRRGKLSESIEPFRRATRSNEDYLPLTFDFLWQSSGGDIETLKSVTKDNPAAQLSLVQFFLEQSLVSEALNIFRSMDRDVKLSSTKSATFIRSLINAKQFEPARALWLDLVASSSESSGQSSGQSGKPSGEVVWNGSFELNSVKNFDHFDWTISTTKYARIGIDTRVARTGSRSMRFAFAGIDTTTLNGEVKQMIVLKPGTRYLLECYAKSADLQSPHGPRIAILRGGEEIAISEPVTNGSSDWQRLVVDFVSPEDSSPKFIAVVRKPKFSYDDPTRGSVWFDDFALTELAR
ncbi:MAG: hypothetical protein L0220_04810 [Acidobacteria bacterium]|nr:hypothetical protein [Acidobacteriota bacterium]